MKYDVIVVGGGPAGLAAAVEASKNGAEKVLVVERDQELGGILNQCIHNGFGLHYFKEELTGPEYAGKFIDMLNETNIEVMLDTMVLDVDETEKCVHAMNKKNVNIEGYMVGKKVLILGSGDIGLIMARRMSLEGAKVVGCVELCPYSNGLNRNIVQCLNDYDIPLYLSHTITDIQGDKRVEKVIVSKVDEKNQPIPGTEMEFDVDTVLLSVGLIPENELTRSAGITMDPATIGPVVYENMETSAEGIFASGNVVHVHDLVDFVTAESQKAGKSAAEYVKNGETKDQTCIDIKNGDGVNGIVPQKVRPSNVDKKVEVMFRARNVFTDVAIKVRSNGEELASFKREHMAPGEMEKIVIPKAFLDKVENGEITVSVEKVGA